MSEKKYDAKLDQIKGNLKEGFGKVAGDKKLEAEGFTEEAIAKGKKLTSDVREDTGGAVEDVKKALHRDN